MFRQPTVGVLSLKARMRWIHACFQVARLGSARLGLAWLDLARLGLAQLGVARRGVAWCNLAAAVTRAVSAVSHAFSAKINRN